MPLLKAKHGPESTPDRASKNVAAAIMSQLTAHVAPEVSDATRSWSWWFL